MNKTVNCHKCGKEIEVYDSEFINIPKYKCDKCAKRK